MVEFGAVSTPWPEQNQGYVLAGGEIVPRSWMFVGDKMMPYEFGYNEASKDPVYRALPDKPQFYSELNDILVSYGLTDLLGLQLNTDSTEEGTSLDVPTSCLLLRGPTSCLARRLCLPSGSTRLSGI